MLRSGRPDAAAAIWDWRAEDIPTDAAALSPSKARLHGVIQGAVGGAVGTALYFFLSQTMGTVVWCLASLIALSALLSPGLLYMAIQRLFAATGAVLSLVVTFISMVTLFYLFFLPFGALFRRGRRDKMRRYFETEGTTYWVERDTATAPGESRKRLY